MNYNYSVHPICRVSNVDIDLLYIFLGSTAYVKAYFCPFYRNNPYQRLLMDALRGVGVEAIAGQSIRTLAHTTILPNEVVHLHWLSPAPRTLGLQIRWLAYVYSLLRIARRAPIVITVHNLIPHESQYPRADRWLNAIIMRYADCIICHSNAAKDEIKNAFGVSASSKSRVIPHGHYIECYSNDIEVRKAQSALGVGGAKATFLFMGRIRQYKGVEMLVSAFRQIDDPKVRLVIAGKPYDTATESCISDLVRGDPRIVFHPGFVADDQLQLYFNATDVVVLPYKGSLTSGALILAMSFAKACIVPRLPSMTECVTNEGAVFYDVDAPDALRKAMDECIARASELPSMGAHNYRVASTLTWPEIARETANCYKLAIQKRRGSSATRTSYHFEV